MQVQVNKIADLLYLILEILITVAALASIILAGSDEVVAVAYANEIRLLDSMQSARSTSDDHTTAVDTD